MTTTAMILLPSAPATVDPVRIFRREPLFAAAGFLLAALMLPTAFALAVDTRALHGIDIWMKPLKFEAALSLYLLTLAIFANWLPEGMTKRRWYRIFSVVVATSAILEISWIGLAAAMGTASHFNTTSPAFEAIYPVMGGVAVILTSGSLVYGIQIARNRESSLPPAFRASLVHGLILTFVLTLFVAGYMSSTGSHLVGGNGSDAEAAAVFGWARDGGDLRVAHLFATHAMHAIPLFGLVSAGFFGRSNLQPVRLFSLAYILLVVFTLAQAIMGQPFLPMIG